MRVLLCVPAYKPALDYGGPVTKISLLAPALQQLGVDLEILTANFGVGRSRIEPGRREVDGVPVTYLRRIAARGWLSVAPGAKGVVAGGGFDAVHCFGLRDGVVLSAARAATRAQVPLVLEPMGMAVARIRNQAIKRSFDALTKPLLRRVATTIATSELEATELEALRYPNVVVRPNPIAVAPRAAARPPAQFDLCYVGRLHAKKRLTDIVAALAAHPSLTAVIAGPDDDGTAAVLQRAATEAGITDRLQLRGWVRDDERQQLLVSSRCFVLPSATENFGNAAAEAIAVGTPALVTDQCGVAELVRETGMGVVVEVSTDAVINGIGMLVGGADNRAGAVHLGRYTTDSVADLQRRIYASLIAS